MKDIFLIIQHAEGEGLGTIDGLLKRKGVYTHFIKVFKNQRIPRTPDGYSGLIVLGGPMGVYEDDLYPFIKDEIDLIEKALRKDIPILGICLGAQMLAKAGGSDVYRGKRKEIGWYRIILTDAGKRDRLFIGLPDKFIVFQWHGDTFDIPEGSICLGFSDLFPHQIIKVGKRAYGLQFHLEVTEGMVRDWVDANDRELASLKYIKPDGILKETPKNIQALNRLGEVVFCRFLELMD